MTERQNARLIRNYIELIESQTTVFNNIINTINRQNTSLRELINNSISYDLSSLNEDINDGTFFRSRPQMRSTMSTANANANADTTNTQNRDNNNRPISRRPRRIVRRNRANPTNTRSNSLFNNVMFNRQPFTFTSLRSVPIPMTTRTSFSSNIPTLTDIYNSTSTYTFRATSTTTDSSNNICPIDRQPYTDGDEIIKINHCGHTFRRRNLLNWFTRQATCPICRHDIRTIAPTATTTTRDNTTNSTSITPLTSTSDSPNDFINELSSIISNTMHNVLENSDTSNNIITAEVEFNSNVPLNLNSSESNQTDSSNNLLPADDLSDIV